MNDVIRSLLFSVLLVAPLAVSTRAEPKFVVEPQNVELNGNFAQLQLLVTEATDGAASARSADATGWATYESSDSAIFQVNDRGRLLAIGNGKAKVLVSVDGQHLEVPVVVAGISPDSAIDFTTHVRPILNKAGCAGAACHASQHGKGGFKLSVFGYDPQADYTAIVRDRMQRRISLIKPEDSLFLQKPTTRVPHGGGKRFGVDSVKYQTLLAWVAGGARAPAKESPKVSKVTVIPSQRIAKVNEKQQLRVVAHYENGKTRDVTALALYDSMDDGVLAVTESGLVKSVGQGQAPIMVRFEGQAEIATFLVPYAESAELAGWQDNNFVDTLAAKKFRELGLEPSPLCDDATFVRRAFLDCIGSLPSVEVTRRFVGSADPKKREKLIDQLLGLTGDPALDVYNDQYAAYWTLKWSDLLRNSSASIGEQGMWALHNWIKESFRTNKQFDQFVRELVTAKGSIYMNGPANYFRIHRNSSELTEATAQLFLGVRLECAKCHHHPFEKYSQADYYGFSAFFSRVGTKSSEEFGLFGRETVVMVKSSGSVRHPKTGKTMQPTPLDGEPLEDPLDLRIPLAKWLTSPENDLFAKAVVNRYLGYLLGHGLVEPLDDMRSTNPPSNVELMNALAKDFVDSGYDLKQLVRRIMTSRLYQLSSSPTKQNAADNRFYSHFRVKRIPAESLLDALDQVTGVQTKFKSLPLGTQAIELPDAEYPNVFLKTFAKPKRASVCECERSPHENLAQALHTLNGDFVAKKVADKKGLIATLVASKRPHEELVEEIYFAALCRPPTEEEIKATDQFLAESPNAGECYEDLLWALLNSKQFLFVY